MAVLHTIGWGERIWAAPSQKAAAQAIMEPRAWPSQHAFQKFQAHGREAYPALVRQLERDLPELLSFFAFPRYLCRKLRTTNVIERCFVNVQSVDSIVFVFSDL